MKFLTDIQTRHSFVVLLRKLHDVATAFEQGFVGVKDDSRLVAWARIHSHTFLTFDRLRGEGGLWVAQEIRLNGGRVICISGGPDQEPERALGKLLFHWHDWNEHFSQEDGIVELADIRKPVRWHPRSNIQARLRSGDRVAFEEYVKSVEKAKKRPLARSRRVHRAKEQQPFDERFGLNG